jgi:hypothetical protein
MRTIVNLAASAALLMAGVSMARAKGPVCAAPACAAPVCAPEPSCGAEPTCVAGTDGCLGDPCCGDGCGDGCGNGRGRGPKYEGLDYYFNCGCNGSYKFPVPPLYTYHWPGMYQQQLMTDYHSPWRFPPLKPYVDEVPAVQMGRAGTLPGVRTVSHLAPIVSQPAAEPQSMSQRMLRGR